MDSPSSSRPAAAANADSATERRSLADLMQKGIHALAIDARAPDEQQKPGP